MMLALAELVVCTPAAYLCCCLLLGLREDKFEFMNTIPSSTEKTENPIGLADIYRISLSLGL